jgi:hypothetical protein
VVVLSLFEMGDILDRENHTVETFIVRCLYALVLAYVECGRSLSLSRALRLHHDETRGCLYDFNQNKVEIVRSLDKPKLCADCLARLGHAQIDAHSCPRFSKNSSEYGSAGTTEFLIGPRGTPSRLYCWLHYGQLS